MKILVWYFCKISLHFEYTKLSLLTFKELLYADNIVLLSKISKSLSTVLQIINIIPNSTGCIIKLNN